MVDLPTADKEQMAAFIVSGRLPRFHPRLPPSPLPNGHNTGWVRYMRAAPRLCRVWGRLAVCRARAMSAPGQLQRCPRAGDRLLFNVLPFADCCTVHADLGNFPWRLLAFLSLPAPLAASIPDARLTLPFRSRLASARFFCVSGLATGGGVGRSTEVQTGRKCGSAPPTYGAILGIGSGIGRLSDVTATSARLSLIARVFDPVTAASRVRTHSHRRAQKPSLVRGLPLPDSYRVVCMHGGVHWSAIPFVFMHAR